MGMDYSKLNFIQRAICKWYDNKYVNIPDRDMTMAFAVTDDNPMWLAVHQAINEIEKETVETARKCSANPSLSQYHLGASEGVTMVRLRLIEKRNLALKELNQKTA